MIQEDLHIFLKDFGKEILFTSSDGTSVLNKDINGNSLLGIFDSSYCSPEMGYMVVISNNPILTCVWDDVKTVKQGYSCLVDGENYKVMSNLPDGNGMSITKLSNK